MDKDETILNLMLIEALKLYKQSNTPTKELFEFYYKVLGLIKNNEPMNANN